MPSRQTTPKTKSDTKPETDESSVRLQKVLAAAGHGSRRHCEEFIQTGRVTVDGKTVTELGYCVDPDTQKIQLDGENVAVQRKVYYVLNKPTGCLCTNNDPSGRRRVVDLFPKVRERLFTVGRLDENSEGLILVTNDGEFANRLAHPRYRVPRTYEVQVVGIPTQETFQKMREGIHLSDGLFRIQRAKKLRTKGKSTVLQLILSQGRNREIRRMLAKIGHKVMKLKRVQFGPLKLGRVTVGEYRPLNKQELRELKALIERKSSPRATPSTRPGAPKKRPQRKVTQRKRK